MATRETIKYRDAAYCHTQAPGRELMQRFQPTDQIECHVAQRGKAGRPWRVLLRGQVVEETTLEGKELVQHLKELDDKYRKEIARCKPGSI